MANQQFRHEAKAQLALAAVALMGEPGLTYDEQIARLEIANIALDEAKKAVGNAIQHVVLAKAVAPEAETEPAPEAAPEVEVIEEMAF